MSSALRRTGRASTRLAVLLTQLFLRHLDRLAAVVYDLIQDLRAHQVERALQRDEAAWHKWNELLNVHRTYNTDLLQIVSIRQRARTGTKAYGRWLLDGASEAGDVLAIWAEGMYLQRGQYVAVHGSVGDGPHHREQVFYFNARPIAVAPPHTLAQAQRYQQHLADTQPPSV